MSLEIPFRRASGFDKRLCGFRVPDALLRVEWRGRKLGYLHPMETGLSGTFVLTESEERELAVTDGLPRALRQAMRDGAVAGGVRWCWMEFPDLDAVDAFVHIVRLKHQLLARPE